MRWGIYARNEFEGAHAFAAGVLELGHKVKVLSAPDYHSGQTEDFDLVAVFGLQGKGPQILADYKALGIPVLVIDYGYLKRTNYAHDWRTGHWQVSLNGLNNLPAWCNSKRFDALGIDIIEHGGDPDGYVLLCAQTTGDASHGMDLQGIQSWVNEQKTKWPNLQLRPHPLEEHLTYETQVCQEPSLERALSKASLMVTGNSNSGHEALLLGIPCLATVPGAAWSPLSGVQLPSLQTRLEHFHRLAWGQWTWAEFRTGQPQAFLLTDLRLKNAISTSPSSTPDQSNTVI